MNLFVQNQQSLRKSASVQAYIDLQYLKTQHLSEELTDRINKGIEFYENFIILGDFNIDVKVAGRELDKL